MVAHFIGNSIKPLTLDEIMDMDMDLNDIKMPQSDDSPVVVFTGSIVKGEGLRFWYCPNMDAAERFMNEISPEVFSDWAYLEIPPLSTGLEKKLIESQKIVEFPETNTIVNDKGKLIGIQGEISVE